MKKRVDINLKDVESVLMRVEWIAMGHSSRECPCCRGWEYSYDRFLPSGHNKFCMLAELLEKLGQKVTYQTW